MKNSRQKFQKEFSLVFSGAMHDIKNPLSSIIVLLQLLKRQLKSNENKKTSLYLKKIEDQTLVILNYINQLSTAVRIAYNTFEIYPEFVKVIECIPRDLNGQRTNITGDLGVEIIADKKRLTEAVTYIVLYLSLQSNAPITIDLSEDKHSVAIAFFPVSHDIIDTSRLDRLSDGGFLLPVADAIISKHKGKLIVKNERLIFLLPRRINDYE